MFPHLLAMKWWDQMPWSSFSECWALRQLFHFHQEALNSSSSLSAIRVVSSAYLRLLIFLPAVLIPACASSSPAFLMMYSAYKLNEQGDNIQPCLAGRTPWTVCVCKLANYQTLYSFWSNRLLEPLLPLKGPDFYYLTEIY